MTTLNVNGKTVTVDADPSTPLLWVIREQLGMTGTKYGCGVAQCGSCTVLMNGEAVRTCVYPLSAVGNQKIETIESLERNGQLTKIQNAWVQHEVPQCGYCQSGMVMATTALLRKKPQPTDADIDAAITNICRCGTYNRIRAAIKVVANGGDARGAGLAIQHRDGSLA